MSQEQQKNTYATTNTMATGDTQMKMMSSIVPGSKKTKTISIYNPFTEKMSRVAPYRINLLELPLLLSSFIFFKTSTDLN